MPALLASCVFLGGCAGWARLPVAPPKPQPQPARLPPLPVQQLRAYAEAQTGLFVSLADFEPGTDGAVGRDQLRLFRIAPAPLEPSCRFVVNITRTGTGAMEATLAGAAELVFEIPDIHDLREYTLLSMALYSRQLRDDLRVLLTSDAGSWVSPRQLVRPGWNNVLIDLHRLVDEPQFDLSRVREVRIGFSEASGEVLINLDDVLLIDNRRVIRPAPPGICLKRVGLNWRVEFADGRPAVVLGQCADGLWRLGAHQALARLARPGGQLGEGPENLVGMGWRRIGRADLLEHNEIRLRLASTWFFPSSTDDWASSAPRYIRWEYTFYPDGRCVSHVQINNAGAGRIGAAGIWLDLPAAWADKGIFRALIDQSVSTPVMRWRYLLARPDESGRLQRANYLSPGRIEPAEGRSVDVASTNAERGTFDSSEACYRLRGNGRRCRFVLTPPPDGLLNPVFRIEGDWRGPVHINWLGRAVRNGVILSDGSLLFVLTGMVTRPTVVEVTGPCDLLASGQL